MMSVIYYFIISCANLVNCSSGLYDKLMRMLINNKILEKRLHINGVIYLEKCWIAKCGEPHSTFSVIIVFVNFFRGQMTMPVKNRGFFRAAAENLLGGFGGQQKILIHKLLHRSSS